MVHQEWAKRAYTLMSIAESFSNTLPIPLSMIERVKHQPTMVVCRTLPAPRWGHQPKLSLSHRCVDPVLTRLRTVETVNPPHTVRIPSDGNPGFSGEFFIFRTVRTVDCRFAGSAFLFSRADKAM